jgi:citrate lyase subunit beta/citryl-CoA lyase
MPSGIREARSLLFAPGSDERKLSKALESDADGVIADLEDAVAPKAKASARGTLRRSFSVEDARPCRLVRVNAADTPDFEADLDLVRELNLTAVVVPKASRFAVAQAAKSGVPIIALIETATGLQDSAAIAGSPGVIALALGGIDLGASLNTSPRADGLELLFARSKLVMDSAAAGLRPPFDSVQTDLLDMEALEASSRRARSLGMGGRLCIHPNQIASVNRAFSPEPQELDEARRLVAAYEAAIRSGEGALNFEGRMVDKAVVDRARRMLVVGGQD